MIQRITLTNFMSHRKTVIEPAPGLTVLVGENNCGKSAVVAALQALCQNASGDYMVRHGEKDCRVKIETHDGHVVEWRRIKNKVSYCLDGKDIDRLKGSIPDDLHNLLRLPLVDANGEEFDVHFGEQKSPIFLLNNSASNRAAFFASSSDAAKLIKMQSLHRNKIRDARSEERSLAKREIKLRNRREQFQPLEEIEQRLGNLDKQFEQIDQQEQKAARLRQTIAELQSANNQCEVHEHFATTLAHISTPPKQTQTEPLRHLICNLQTAAIRSTNMSERCRALNLLSGPVIQSETRSLRQLIERLQTTALQIEIHQQRQQSHQELSPPPILADTHRLQGLLCDLESASISLVHYTQAAEILREIDKPAQPASTEPLRTLIDALSRLQQQINSLEDLADHRAQALKEAEHDLKHLGEDAQSCPLCGQQIDAETLIAKTTLSGGSQ